MRFGKIQHQNDSSNNAKVCEQILGFILLVISKPQAFKVLLNGDSAWFGFGADVFKAAYGRTKNKTLESF